MRAGFGRTTLTPSRNYDLSGFVARDNPGKGVHDGIEIRALHIEAGKRALLLSVGVLGFTPQHALELRRKIAAQLGMDEQMVMLAATHTHSAPATMPLMGCGKVDWEWIQQLEAAILECARQAVQDSQPVRMGVAKVQVPGVARNRRDPDGPLDQALTCLKVQGADGNLLGIVGNFTCHPVVLGGDNLLVSNDYPGAFIRRLEEQGITALFLMGACGDINPQLRGDFEAVEAIASRLSDAALECVQDVETWEGSVIGGAHSVRIEWEWPTAQELEAHGARVEAARPDETSPSSAARVYAVYREWLERHRNRPDQWPAHLDITLQVIGIGPMRLVGLPGEIFCATGLSIKEFLGPSTMVAGYTNGNLGYVPTEDAYAKGGYEVDDAHRYYDYPGVVRKGTAERMVEAVRTLAGTIL